MEKLVWLNRIVCRQWTSTHAINLCIFVIYNVHVRFHRSTATRQLLTYRTHSLQRCAICCCCCCFDAHCWCKPRSNFNGLMIFKPISFFFLLFSALSSSSFCSSTFAPLCVTHSCCVRFYFIFFVLFCLRSISFYSICNLIAIWHNKIRARCTQQIPQLNSVTF